MPEKTAHVEDLHRAIDDLVTPGRIKLHREDTGATEWQTVPSLWVQLEGAVAYSGNGGSAVAKSKPPITTGVVALIIEISTATTETATELAGESRRNVPANLRAIAATFVGKPDIDLLDWWVTSVKDWVRQARVLLRLDPDRPKWARGTRCPDCGADTATAQQDGETVRTPALSISWSAPEGSRDQHHADSEWHVRAIECRACSAVWWRGADLDQLVTDMLLANQTKETMTG